MSKDIADGNQTGSWHKVEFGMQPTVARAALRIGDAKTDEEILRV